MKIGIFADTHDHLDNIRLAVEEFNRRECELVIFAGDLVSTFAIPPLRKLNCPMVASFGDNEGNKIGVRGGMQIIGEIGEPPFCFRAADGTRFVVTHQKELLGGAIGETQVVVYAHTHKPRIDHDDRGRLWINPGETSGWSYRQPSIAFLDTNTMQAEIVWLDDVRLQPLAERQLADFDMINPGAMFAEGIHLDIEEAYRVQTLVARMRIVRGEQVVGYKVGCQSPELRKHVGIEHPVCGRLWAAEQHPSGVELPLHRFAEAAFEGELAVRLAGTIEPEMTDEEIIACIGEAFPVIELHHNRLHLPANRGAELIANNAIHAGVVANEVKGTWNEIAGSMQIYRDQMLIAECDADELRTNALRSLRWLSKELESRDESLEPGQTVLTGTLAGLYNVDSPSHVAVEVPQLGRVEASFG